MYFHEAAFPSNIKIILFPLIHSFSVYNCYRTIANIISFL